MIVESGSFKRKEEKRYTASCVIFVRGGKGKESVSEWFKCTSEVWRSSPHGKSSVGEKIAGIDQPRHNRGGMMIIYCISQPIRNLDC